MTQDEKSPNDFPLEIVEVVTLHPHPRNYRTHPDDQLDHLIESIRANGFYRNIVIARDGTILAGHGMVEAIRKMGLTSVPVVRLDLDPNESRALKVLTGDNTIQHLGIVDDRALTEILKEIKDVDMEGLLGTGFDDQMLANLLYVTRPASEIRDFDAAAEWVGMPEYAEGAGQMKVNVHFRNKEDRADFARILNAEIPDKMVSWMWWPIKERKDDIGSIRFEEG